MDIQVIKECSRLSLAGEASFIEIIQKLQNADIERYMVDLVRHMNHYYAKNSESSSHALDFKGPSVTEKMDTKEIKSAIKDSQAGDIKYSEFLTRIMAAGCCRYEVFITGKQVIYTGREGEQHVEAFPNKK